MQRCAPRRIRSAVTHYGDAARISCSGPTRKPAATRRPAGTTGLPYWPYHPQLRFEVPLLPAQREVSLSVPASDGVIPMARIGCVRLPPPVDPVIDGWWLRQYAGGLFLPLRDGTAASPATVAAGTRSTPLRAPTWATDPGG